MEEKTTDPPPQNDHSDALDFFIKKPGVKLYEDLELKREATDSQIKKKYRELALRFHPDKNFSSEGGEKFKSVSHAYRILSDGKKRSIYDEFGESGIEKLEEFEKSSEEVIKTIWKYRLIGIGAWLLIALIDYFISFPLEWLVSLVLTGGLVYTVKKDSVGLIIPALILDVLLYFAIPSHLLPILANISLITVFTCLANTTVATVDISVVVWVLLCVLEVWVRNVVVPFSWVSVLGVHTLTVSSMATFFEFLIFYTQYIPQERTSVIAPRVGNYLQQSPIFAFLFWAVVWLLDYYTTIPWEWIIGSLLCVLSIWNTFYELSIPKVLLIISIFLFITTYYDYLLPYQFILYSSNLLMIITTIVINRLAVIVEDKSPLPLSTIHYLVMFAVIVWIDLNRNHPNCWFWLGFLTWMVCLFILGKEVLSRLTKKDGKEEKDGKDEKDEKEKQGEEKEGEGRSHLQNEEVSLGEKEKEAQKQTEQPNPT